MNEIMIDLQGGAKAPLYEKIYEYIKNEIVDGKISKGEKLPSTRLLAKNLSVSRKDGGTGIRSAFWQKGILRQNHTGDILSAILRRCIS